MPKFYYQAEDFEVNFVPHFILPLFLLEGIIQLGQPSVNPPRLVLEVGGTSTLQAAMPVKLKWGALQGSKWGGLQLSRHGCLLS